MAGEIASSLMGAIGGGGKDKGKGGGGKEKEAKEGGGGGEMISKAIEMIKGIAGAAGGG